MKAPTVPVFADASAEASSLLHQVQEVLMVPHPHRTVVQAQAARDALSYIAAAKAALAKAVTP